MGQGGGVGLDGYVASCCMDLGLVRNFRRGGSLARFSIAMLHSVAEGLNGQARRLGVALERPKMRVD